MSLEPIRLFEKGIKEQRLTELGYEIILSTFMAGHVRMTSGRLVVCDPLENLDADPFRIRVPIGSYPIEMVFSKLRDDTRLAYLVIRLMDGEVVGWENAQFGDGDSEASSAEGGGRRRLESQDEEEGEGIWVSSTIVAVGDEDAMSVLLDIGEEDEEERERELRHWLHRRRRGGDINGTNTTNLYPRDLNLAKTMLGRRRPAVRHGTLSMDDLGESEAWWDANVFLTETDPGVYQCYWGLSATQQELLFVIDFGVMKLRFTRYGLF